MVIPNLKANFSTVQKQPYADESAIKLLLVIVTQQITQRYESVISGWMRRADVMVAGGDISHLSQ